LTRRLALTNPSPVFLFFPQVNFSLWPCADGACVCVRIVPPPVILIRYDRRESLAHQSGGDGSGDGGDGGSDSDDDDDDDNADDDGSGSF
jgi:hypothetical protein